MLIQKIHFAIDKTTSIKSFEKKIIQSYKKYSPKKCNVIIVIGGDGFMLQTLKRYQRYKKPFYGMNKGTFGFLMNKFKIKNIKKNISKANQISISPLLMNVLTKNKNKKTAIAVNEVSLLRQSKQTASLQIKNGKKILIKKLVSDGVMVSTPAGSTAYNLSVYGPILSLNSNKLAITPISPFRPRRWKGKIVKDTSLIRIENLNTQKRPISAVADNFEVRNVKRVNIKINKNIFFKLLYDKNSNLTKKIKLEQLRKQTI